MLSWSQELERSAYAMDGQRWAGLRAQRVASVDSTNSALLRSAQAGDTAPQVLWAQAQTAGRGRMGRLWLGAPADANGGTSEASASGLYFSVGLTLAPRDWSGLSLALGLAVAQTLHISVGVKWPNDLWLRQGPGYAKLGGILIETAALPHAPEGAARWVVIGLGLNLRDAPQAPDLRTPATDIASGLPTAAAAALLADTGLLCARLTAAMVQAAVRFEQAGFASFVPDYHARDVLYGQPLHSSAGASGMALGVDAQGHYQIQQGNGELLRISSAEISLRPGAL